MKLITSIQPRRDGTVIARGNDGAVWEFKPEASGDLTCEVSDEVTVAILLSTGSFYPANDGDMDAALRMAMQVQEDGGDCGDDEDDHGDGLPVESNTPLQPARRGRKASSKS